MTRKEALALLESKIDNKNLIKHMFATEACMIALAKKFHEPIESYALSGLLHDLDYNETKCDFPMHGKLSVEYLKNYNLDNSITNAIEAHAGHIERNTLIAKVLFAVDPLTGLIVAATLMHPEKKLALVTPEFILKRFKEKHFAKGANRTQICACETFNMPLEEFVYICLTAMQEIATDLGL